MQVIDIYLFERQAMPGLKRAYILALLVTTMIDIYISYHSFVLIGLMNTYP